MQASGFEPDFYTQITKGDEKPEVIDNLPLLSLYKLHSKITYIVA
jgi:hypothetical protein